MGAPARRLPQIIGQISGIALVYDVLDRHGTTFRRGCLASAQAAVAAGTVPLWWCHRWSDPTLRVGVVTALRDVELDDGRWGAELTADIDNTALGRETLGVCEAALGAGREVGLSIGAPRDSLDGLWTHRSSGSWFRFCQVNLREISLTLDPSVPGARVISVRRAPPAGWATRADRLAALDAIDAPRERMGAGDRFGVTGWVTSVGDGGRLRARRRAG